jgi:FtsP/CotA-like multicopper oxidase with cupredoxin domain
MSKRSRSLSLVNLVVVVIVVAGSLALRATSSTSEPSQACDTFSRTVTLFAERINAERIGYGLSPDKPTIPGPTITMYEGDCIEVTLVNDTDQLISLHPHGVDYTVASDGTSVNGGCVPPGRSKTYVWSSHTEHTRPDGTIDPGDAGYWHYHDHCMGTPHGTGGLKAGLFGPLIIRRQGDLLPDRPTFVVVMGPGQYINLKKEPRTPVFVANQGERVEFEVIAYGDDFHTFHLHGHRWVDNRTGYITSLDDQTRLIDNHTVGPADSFGFQVIAGEGVGPGAWMYHCHVQMHSDAGMVGFFLVRRADGTMTPQEKLALYRWRHMSHHHMPGMGMDG